MSTEAFTPLNADGGDAEAGASAHAERPASSKPHQSVDCLKRTVGILVILSFGLFIGLIVAVTQNSSSDSDPSVLTDSGFVGKIQKADMMKTLEGLYDVALAHNKTRSMRIGANASVDYMLQRVTEETDYAAHIETFTVDSADVVKASLAIKSPAANAKTYIQNADFSVRQGNGNVANGKLVVLPEGGCDLTGVAGGDVVIMVGEEHACGSVSHQRELIAESGAGALLYYYRGESLPVLSHPAGEDTIPIFFVSNCVGDLLTQMVTSGTEVRMTLESELKYTTVVTRSLIVDTALGDEDNIIVVGSHIDSVDAGPGINDDGSGSAANLQMLLEYKALTPINRARFCFFGAEEEGLLGSFAYVRHLNSTNPTTHALDKVVAMIDIDMLASPNGARHIYNASSGAAPKSTVKGNLHMQGLFQEYYDMHNLPYIFDEFDGRSDYQGFLLGGVPAGGITTGAEVIKSMELRKIFGGTANTAFDPCYHQACDTIDNVDMQYQLEMARGAAFALEKMIMDTDIRETMGRPKTW